MSSNSKHLNESNFDNKSREIKVLLQISKSISIDRFTTISNLKTVAKQQFKGIAEDFRRPRFEVEGSCCSASAAERPSELYKTFVSSHH